MEAQELLEDMHRRCDDLLMSLDSFVQREAWPEAETTYGRLRTSMRAHFEAEEEELFPAFERQAYVNATSTAIMRREHQRMNAMMDHMGGAIAVCDVVSYLNESVRLRSLLTQHARKEDFLMDAVFGVATQASDRHLA
ncbi:hemerythrin domain-containing protein [Viridibacterium curvum]|uniref:Hemerythrin-like domain-containing protein n=1 Tax=Viridibacterium curvum TaxID=1101404 RepID=A0ABP9QV97_9RHOO